MQILFLAIALTLVAAPLQSLRLLWDAERWERAQIAVDNAALALGQADRTLFNAMEAWNAVLKITELAHHPLHVCARVPVTQAYCAPLDRAVEAEIRALMAAGQAVLRLGWPQGEASARVAAGSLGTTVLEVDRPRQAPWRARRCNICQMDASWEHTGDGKASLKTPVPVPLEGGVHLKRSTGGKWEYQVKAKAWR